MLVIGSAIYLGGNYRLVAAFDFRRQIAFVKFIGTHAEYDRIDASTVSQF
jgi:mRNA interferase HigB